MNRIIVGILIAPLVPVLAILLLIFWGYINEPQAKIAQSLGFAVGFGFLTMAISYLITFLAGLPILAIALKYGFVRLHQCLFIGFLISIIPAYFFSDHYRQSWLAYTRPLSLISLSSGVIMALIFWLIARPDKFLEAQKEPLEKQI